MTAGVIARAARLKVIGRAGTGVDNIDLDAATRRGYCHEHPGGKHRLRGGTYGVDAPLACPEHTAGPYEPGPGGMGAEKFHGDGGPGEDGRGCRLGKIGREVASRCVGMGMKILGYDPVLAPDAAARLSIELVNLPELFRRADFITVHTPLTPETKGLLNDETLARCKKGVRVINCARGGIIDEKALLRALESGHVGGAALDVFEVEPPKDNPLLRHPRVIATPHLGASTEEAQEKVAVQIAHEIADALHGRAYAGVVNGSAMLLTLKEEVRPYIVLAEKLGAAAVQIARGS